MSRTHHLAQINVARMRARLDDPLMADFVAQLDAINALADRAPGFVWRLQPEGNGTAVHAVTDPLILVNLSVWESLESLHAYVYRSAHAEVMRDRKRWFAKYDGPYYALWWVERDHVPTVDQGFARLARLAEGPSPYAFWFGSPHAAPDEPEAHMEVPSTKSRP